MIRRTLALAAAAALSLGLAGCITLFPKETPAQMYRFEATPPAASGVPPAFTVRNNLLGFDNVSAGDQIVTSTGDEVAFLRGARWAAPAQELFEGTLAQAFAVAGGPARVIGAGAPGHADLRLTVQVTRFEADYVSGPTAAPTVVVRLHAALVHEKDMSPAGERIFQAEIPAADNHLAAIVTAYDAATTKAVGELIAWVEQGGG
jgi:cholesterol transport system auxiliary component